MVTLGENARSYCMLTNWDAEFKRDRDNLEHDPCWRRPVTSQETIATIIVIIMADRRVSECYIVTELGVSQDRIYAVIHNKLHMCKVSARCVPNIVMF